MSDPPARILVVDDDPINRLLLTADLEDAGHIVLEAEHGRQALDVLSADPVDAVLLDIEMPEMDGYAVLDLRRRTATLRDIPFIVISSIEDMASIVRCIELGAEDYLPKPADRVLLRARIGACLEKKRLHDALARQAAELAEWNRTLEARVDAKVQEVERLSRLQRFFSPQLAEAILAGDADLLASHRRDITVVFCDLRGFTAFAESAEPEDVMGVLRELHGALGPLVFAHQGTLERFTGDGMMIFFNDPAPVVDPALQAVAMALAMREQASGLSQVWRRRGHRLEMGIGIASGYATCGRIGYEGRFDYAAIGTVTNIAGRLSGVATGGQILVTERVCMMVEGLVEARPIGEVELKGITRPTMTYEVLGMAPTTAAPQP